MSKHPIPDWLRSQFSRIEDEVRKLGPCGVFTQMRTVTQTYFEQLAAAPQRPALGGEVEIGIGSDEVIEELKMMADMADNNEDPDDHMMYMRWLSAIRSANAQVATRRAEIDAYKASRERLHQWLREEQLKNIHLAEERDQLKARCDELEGASQELVCSGHLKILPEVMQQRFTSCIRDAQSDSFRSALSKPAGSEQA